MSRKPLPLLASLLLATLLTALPAVADDCRYRDTHRASLDAGGAELAEIAARAGELHITGRPGLGEARIEATACASTRELLAEIELIAEREGDRLVIAAEIPETSGWRSSASLDLEIEVPESLALDIADSSGEMLVRGVGSADIVDSSGEIRVEGVRGDLRIRDSSGEIDVVDAAGEVRINDSSGDIEVRRVGSLIVEQDSSGDIDATEVVGDVIVERDSSGSIDVRGVGGDFVVERDGSGGIYHRDVAGSVRLPR